MTVEWWWWPHRRAPGQRPVLFFPPAGGDQTVARSLVPLAGALGLGVLRLPGRGPRQAEAAPNALETLAATIADSILALDGPAPLLVGHSFGGLLAYVAACRVEAAGGEVGRLVAVTSASPPSWQQEVAAASDNAAATPEGFAEARTERIVARGGLPAHIVADPELARHARELITTDVGLMQAGFPLQVLRGPVTVICARDDAMVERTALDGWASVSGRPVDTVTVPGDHFFYRADPRILIGHLNMELSALDGAYELR